MKLKSARLVTLLLSQTLGQSFAPAAAADFTDQLISGDKISFKEELTAATGNSLPSALLVDSQQTKTEPSLGAPSQNTEPKSQNLESAPVAEIAAKETTVDSSAEKISIEPVEKAASQSEQSPKNPLTDAAREVPYLTLGATLALIAMVGYFAVKLKKDGLLKLGGQSKKLEIIETLSLGPKRHIFLFKCSKILAHQMHQKIRQRQTMTGLDS
jgi:hypothetical protein